LLYTFMPIFITLILYISVFFILTWKSSLLRVLCWCTWIFCSKHLQYFLIKQVTSSIHKEVDTVLHISWTSDVPHNQNQVIINVTNHHKNPPQLAHEYNWKHLEGRSNWKAALNQKLITWQTCQESYEQKNCALAVSTGHSFAYTGVFMASQNSVLGNA
jgi:c-di-AMP phosphodiesterase-like protein